MVELKLILLYIESGEKSLQIFKLVKGFLLLILSEYSLTYKENTEIYMEEKYTEKYIHQLISSTMQDVKMAVELKQDFSGVNMSYNFIGDYVGFDVKRLVEVINEMQLPISLELYIKIITLHELGHAIDRIALLDSLTRTLEIFDTKQSHSLYELYNDVNLLAMIIEEHEMNIVFEETAWRNAENLNRKFHIVDWENFDDVRAHSLLTYKNLYKQDLHLYEELVAEHTNQIA